MKDNEVQKLVDIRAFLINRYNNLDGRGNIGTAVILQKDVAYMIKHYNNNQSSIHISSIATCG